jgi:hypothetical protein
MSFLGFIFLMLSLLVTALLKSIIGYMTIMMMLRGFRLGWKAALAWLRSLPGMLLREAMRRIVPTWGWQAPPAAASQPRWL